LEEPSFELDLEEPFLEPDFELDLELVFEPLLEVLALAASALAFASALAWAARMRFSSSSNCKTTALWALKRFTNFSRLAIMSCIFFLARFLSDGLAFGSS